MLGCTFLGKVVLRYATHCTIHLKLSEQKNCDFCTSANVTLFAKLSSCSKILLKIIIIVVNSNLAINCLYFLIKNK